MGGLIDHIMINVNDYERAAVFYSWLMPKLGYKKGKYNEPVKKPRRMDWSGELSGMLVCEADEKMKKDTFDKHRVGLREVAFFVKDKATVDEVGRDVEKHGGKIIDKPYQYGDSYVTFFTDPDGIKLEVDWR